MSEYSITPEDENKNQYEPEIDAVKLGQLMDAIKSEQNFLLAILAGLVSSVVAAILWAIVTTITGYQIGFMAIGVGFIVGFSVGFLGKGITIQYGIVGALFALFGCLLGNLLAVIATATQVQGVPFTAILGTFIYEPSSIIDIYKQTFSPIDLLFYGIAVYGGYQGAFRQITEEELAYTQKPKESSLHTNE